MKISIPLAIGLLIAVTVFGVYLFPRPELIGQALEQGGRLDDALSYYQQALAANPEDEATWVRIASVHELRGQPDEAIAVYRRLTDLDPTNVGYHRHLAVLYQWSLKMDEAMGELAKVADLEPKDVGARQALARYSILRSKDYGAALRRLEEIVAARPSDVDALNEVAQLYAQTGQIEKAMRAYDHALEEDPGNPQISRLRSRVATWQQDLEGAIGRYRAAIEVDPNNRPVLTNLAIVLRAAGREPEAVEIERRAAALPVGAP